MSATKIARKLLDQLIELDHTTQAAHYEMGRIIATLTDSKLYIELGYESMSQLIEEELSFLPGTANKYAMTYRHFQRLHYSKKEALKVIMACSFTHVTAALPSAKQKMGERAINNWIAAHNPIQINFAFNKEDHAYMVQVLKSFGAIETNGQLRNSSAALLEALHHV